MMKEHHESLIEYDEVKAKLIAEHLTKKYPGHMWACYVNDGVASIFNLMFSGNWGFRIKTKDIDARMSQISNAGGELLERYNISRGRAKEQEYHDLKRDIAGMPIGDKS